MIADAGLAWPFTAWFAIIGGVSFAGAVRARRGTDRTSYAAHAVMAAAMAAMPWPWFMAIPGLVWIVLFGLAAVGYGAVAIGRPGVPLAPGAGHHARRLVAWYHAAMMLGMVWMSVLMALLIGAATGDAVRGGGTLLIHGHGMTMTLPADGAPPLWHLPIWAVAVTFAFAAMFGAATAWFLLQLPAAATGGDRDPLPVRLELVLSAAMALGMAVAYFMMS